MTILERARTLAALADNLHAECLEMTLPAGALAVLAEGTAHHANAILDLLTCCQPPATPDYSGVTRQPDEMPRLKAETLPNGTARVRFEHVGESLIEEERRRHP